MVEWPHIETFSEPSVFLKMFEFIFTLIAISVEQGGLAAFGDDHREFFGGGVLVMAITVSGLLFLCFIFGEQSKIQATHFELAFNCLTTVLILAAGVVIIVSVSDAGTPPTEAAHGQTAGAFCIISALVYAADTYVAYRGYSAGALASSA